MIAARFGVVVVSRGGGAQIDVAVGQPVGKVVVGGGAGGQVQPVRCSIPLGGPPSGNRLRGDQPAVNVAVDVVSRVPVQFASVGAKREAFVERGEQNGMLFVPILRRIVECFGHCMVGD